MSNNDLEQFDSEALEYFIEFINDGVCNIAAINTNMISEVDYNNIIALRTMIYNAKSIVKKRENVSMN